MIKKTLFITRINRDDPGNAGVVKKCTAQAKAFRKLGVETDLLWLCNQGVMLNEKLVFKKKLTPHSLAIYWFYFLQFGPLIPKLVDVSAYALIYLRHPFFDPLLVRFLKNVKKKFPSLKLILEINTYPYDAEPKRPLHRFSLKMDQYFRKTAHEYIDRVADYGMEKQIWGIPTINIRNGIDMKSLPVSKKIPQPAKLRLIAVGNWSHWHGLDRLIRGMEDYYKNGKHKAEVFLTIVGDGGEKKNYSRMVKESDLEPFIRFLPATTGFELDRLFDDADAGIGTLGLHRKGVAFDSSLKHREYCSRGLPFILSSPDPDFPEDLPFVHYVPDDDAALDMKNLVEVLLKWKVSGREIDIRKYAEEHLTWEKQLSPVVDWLEGNEGV
jgi:glycosyltransferase involved in cell wall biosynthesis